jgi:hypothetical protein
VCDFDPEQLAITTSMTGVAAGAAGAVAEFQASRMIIYFPSWRLSPERHAARIQLT